MSYTTPPLRILITGPSGLIGTALREFLQARGHEVIGLSFSTQASKGNLQWDPYNSVMPISDFTGIDAVVNLTGEKLAQHWTHAAKERIYNSRILATKLLVKTILEASNQPRVFISASGTYTDEINFLNHVIRDWEAATLPLDQTSVRRVNLRLGSVLSKKGGMLATLLPSFKYGLGNYQCPGTQRISWIDIDDLVNVIYFCILNEALKGPVNATSPYPVSNKHFCKAIGKALNRPVWLQVPGFLLKLIFGREFVQELILKDHNVYPQELLDGGFPFQYPHIEESLTHLLK